MTLSLSSRHSIFFGRPVTQAILRVARISATLFPAFVSFFYDDGGTETEGLGTKFLFDKSYLLVYFVFRFALNVVYLWKTVASK